jgi:uncharacterized membrane protein YhaH (DUF805 family)
MLRSDVQKQVTSLQTLGESRFSYRSSRRIQVIDNALMLTAGQQQVQIVSGIFGLVCLLPSINVTIRRLHDLNRSGWWLLLWLFITIFLSTMLHLVGVIIAIGIPIIACCFRGKKRDNRFGSDPLNAVKQSSLRSVLMLLALILAVGSLALLFPSQTPPTVKYKSQPTKGNSSQAQPGVLALNEAK